MIVRPTFKQLFRPGARGRAEVRGGDVAVGGLIGNGKALLSSNGMHGTLCLRRRGETLSAKLGLRYYALYAACSEFAVSRQGGAAAQYEAVPQSAAACPSAAPPPPRNTRLLPVKRFLGFSARTACPQSRGPRQSGLST